MQAFTECFYIKSSELKHSGGLYFTALDLNKLFYTLNKPVKVFVFHVVTPFTSDFNSFI